jgi:hypothetical protein
LRVGLELVEGVRSRPWSRYEPQSLEPPLLALELARPALFALLLFSY